MHLFYNSCVFAAFKVGTPGRILQLVRDKILMLDGESLRIICVFPKIGGNPPKMDGIRDKPMNKWMI